MTEKLTQKDYELINSYLDQELDRKEVIRFAERMAEDQQISSEVADLMKVKAMVRELPTVTPPRNYILTRAMAEEARPKPFWQRLFPVFRTAAAFCALALVLTFVFPLLQSTQTASKQSSKVYEEAAEYDMAASESMEPEESSGSMPLRDEQIVLDDYGTEAYNAVMPSYGVMGGNPRIEYLMRIEEKQNAVSESSAWDAENPPEGFISLEKASEEKWSTALKVVLCSGLLMSIGGIAVLERRKKKLEVR